MRSLPRARRMARSHSTPRTRPRVLVVTSKLDATGGIASYVRAMNEALREVAELDVIDLRIEHDRWSHLRGFLVAIGRAVWTRPDLMLLGHVGFGPVGQLWKMLGGRFVVMAYGMDIWGPQGSSLSRTLRWARSVWPISSFTAAEVQRSGPGARTIAPLGGGIDPSFFQERAPSESPSRVLLVASLANLSYKGADTLVDAVSKLQPDHDVQLRVVGSGTGTPELGAYIDEVGASGHTVLLGRLDHGRLLEEYRRADVIVLLSRFRRGPDPQGEGLGLVVLEAAAAGVPAVVSSVGGATDTVIDGVTGYHVPPGDLDALTGRLDQILSDPRGARALGEAARAFVTDQHSAEMFASRIADAVRQACS